MKDFPKIFDPSNRDCNQPGDSCPMISGKCDHKFHFHCIQKWLTQQNSEDLCHGFLFLIFLDFRQEIGHCSDIVLEVERKINTMPE